jgi:hypothetical protein
MRAGGRLFPIVLFAACSSPQAPDKPTWAEDVQPIIMGSCGHCHGATAPDSGGSFRLDVCSRFTFVDTGVAFGENCDTDDADLSCATTGIVPGLLKSVLGQITSDGAEAPLMPPPPGGPLSSYERDVLVRWLTQNPGCGSRPGNHAPIVKAIGRPVYASDAVTVTLEVDDADGDQVLGSLFVGPDCDPTPPAGYRADPAKSTALASECMMRPRTSIPRTGRIKLTLTGVDPGTALAVRVSDGWKTVARDL